MMSLNSSFRRLSVQLLFVVPLFGLQAYAGKVVSCRQIVEARPTSLNGKKGYEVPPIKWLDDKSYIEGNQNYETLGLVQTHYSRRWNTQVYFTATGRPDANGNAPLVDPKSKAVFVFFHGSGTMKSSGRNFLANMNTLAKLGYSTVSYDMPHHKDGPTSENMYDINNFMKWNHGILTEIANSGKDIILVGHSFGPDVILELASRYPHLAKAVVALSPASFNQITREWYDNFTSKMKFGGNVESNDAGGMWAARMSDQFLWTTGKLKDPTVVNPKLHLRVLSGKREEYFPGPVGGPNGTPTGDNTYDPTPFFKERFANSIVTIQPGIGHYLFDFQDQNGYNVVTREILASVGESPANIKKMTEAVSADLKTNVPTETLQLMYSQNPSFRSWADFKFGPGNLMKLSRRQSDVLAKNIMDEYTVAVRERDLGIQQKIMETKTTHPDFYQKYKKQIDALKSNVLDASLFVPYLREVLK